jgi:hypothetical protein
MRFEFGGNRNNDELAMLQAVPLSSLLRPEEAEPAPLRERRPIHSYSPEPWASYDRAGWSDARWKSLAEGDSGDCIAEYALHENEASTAEQHPEDWLEAGRIKPDAPEHIRALLTNEHFPAVYAANSLITAVSEAAQIKDKEASVDRFNCQLYALTGDILGRVLGLPSHVSKACQEMFWPRCFNYQAASETFSSRVNMDYWVGSMNRLIENLKAVGPHRAALLHETFNTTNFDNYTSDQLLWLSQIAERDPESLAYLRGGNASLVMFEAYDPRRVNDDAPQIFDEENTIIAEITQPGQLAEFPRMMAEDLAAPSCKITKSTHGNRRVEIWGKRWDGSFIIATGPARVALNGSRSYLTLQESGLAGTINDHMVPHTEHGVKIVSLAACHQADRRPLLRSGKDRQPRITPFRRNSMAEHVLRLSARAGELVVFAAQDEIWVHNENDAVVFQRLHPKSREIENSTFSFRKLPGLGLIIRREEDAVLPLEPRPRHWRHGVSISGRLEPYYS